MRWFLLFAVFIGSLAACRGDETDGLSAVGGAATQPGDAGTAGGGAGTAGGGAGGTPDGSAGAAGQDLSFTAGTWNLHNFSKYGENEWRLADIADKIAELDTDLLAVQELKVKDGTQGQPPQAWDKLLELLPDYSGIHNPWNTYDTTVGLLYRTATTSILSSQELFDLDSWAFPRPPLEAEVRLQKGSEVFEFYVIVLHLKAFGDSVDRRRAACQKLTEYLAAKDQPRYLVIGDLNDDPYDHPTYNSFVDTFLDTEPAYYFVTAALPPESVTSVGYYHWVGSQKITGEFLDHAIVTGALWSGFGTITPTIISVPEGQYGSWETSYSDHFPVLVDFVR